MHAAQTHHDGPRGPTQNPLPASDDARLRAMVTEHYDFVWRSIVRLGVPRGDAEDTAQQVFLVAARKLASIGFGSEKSYLFQTARRLAWNARRTIKRRREDGEPAAEHEAATDAPDAALDRSRMRAAMDELIERLEDDVREVFILYELEEMTMIEIARLLELPSGTVASRLRRARTAFREGAERLTARGGLR